MVRDLIIRLGGPAKIAAWCGKELNGNAVTAWGLRNQIPWKWRASIREMARSHSVRLSKHDEAALALIERKIAAE
jgi:hypothetical protein